MKKIIGYTDSVNECECCGKRELKGTFCIDLDGTEVYYGSVCAFKSHGLSIETQKELKSDFLKKAKNQKLIETHILPLKTEFELWVDKTFTTADYEQLSACSKKIYDQRKLYFSNVAQIRIKKYKIIY